MMEPMEPTRLADWDHAGLALAHAARSPWLDSLFATVTWLGSLAVLVLLALLLGWRRCGHRNAAFVTLALIGASALGHLVKLIAARPRPDLFPPLIPMPDDASFPSAHAMQVTAFALAWLLRPGASPGRIEIAVLLAAASLVGASRLYLQVHFPSDVVAGVMLATLWVVLLRRLPAWRENS
ncbi:MAG: phosphatase PAP2 family protein [Propionivibrio sp.]|jgi:undecaprenyl-diphosphatase|nr:phosphatase PAP2 family protein [Propionivibrio sp.]MBK9027666.1 phosphatase PAP2 family protein [Propionivibrio sp.]